MRTHGSGFTLIEILVVAGILALMMGILIPAMVKVRETGRRTTCMNNLRQIGQAVLTYATGNKGQLPRVRWRAKNDSGFWNRGGVAADAVHPFAVTPNGYNDPGAGFFLLVRAELIPVSMFICPSTDDVVDNLGGKSPTERCNFTRTQSTSSDEPSNRSYSFASLYPDERGVAAGFTSKLAQMDPAFALAADYGLPTCGSGGGGGAWSDPGRRGNSPNHRQVGQNVLYVDGSVKFQTTNRCGAGGDNIYRGQDLSACNFLPPISKTDSVLEDSTRFDF